MDVGKLSKWLSRHIERVDAPEGPVHKLVLAHVARGSKSVEVQTITVPYHQRIDPETDEITYGLAVDDIAIADLAQDIFNEAWDDCEGIGGQQAYQLRLYRRNQTQSVGRFSFRLMSEDDFNADMSSIPELGGVSHPLLNQLMRHNEASNRALVMGFGTITAQASRTIKHLSDQNEKLMAGRMAQIELQEELESRKHERDLQTEQMRLSEGRKHDAFEKFMALAPAIVNRVVGRKVLREDVTPTEEMVHGLIQSFTPEQLEKIRAQMNTEQQGVLFELITSAIDRKEAVEEKKLKLLAGEKE